MICADGTNTGNGTSRGDGESCADGVSSGDGISSGDLGAVYMTIKKVFYRHMKQSGYKPRL